MKIGVDDDDQSIAAGRRYHRDIIEEFCSS